MPKPQTELRLGQVADRRSYETEKADETIRTALGADGAVSIQWRPKVAEGQVDRSLTAASNAVLDVQEDGLRLAWQLGLEFRRSQREQFSVALPADYLLEKVEGDNVRGWEIRKTEQGPDRRGHAAAGRQGPRAVHAAAVAQRARSGRANWPQFDVPLVVVADAALHNGQLTIRRSPLLELRTLDRAGVTRTDLPAEAAVGGRGRRRREPAGHPAVRGLQLRRRAVYACGWRPRRWRRGCRPRCKRCCGSPSTSGAWRAASRSTCRAGRSTSCGCSCPTDLRLDQRLGPRRVPICRDAAGQAAAVDDLSGRGPAGQRAGAGARQAAAARASSRNCRCRGWKCWASSGSRATWPCRSIRPSTSTPPTWRTARRCCWASCHGWLNPEQQRVTRLGLHYRAGRLRRHAAAYAPQARRRLRHDHQRPRDRPGDRRDDPAGLHDPATRASASCRSCCPPGWPAAGSACRCCGRRRSSR